jgi:16S rRNA G966 N2-methylase RsmD
MYLGAKIFDFILKNRDKNISEMALHLPSEYKQYQIEILQQIDGYQRAKSKIPTWCSFNNILYPPKLSLEQSSSELTAKYKASLFSVQNSIDLTGGFGIDSYYLSKSNVEHTYIEQDKKLFEIAIHNFKVLNAGNITFYNIDSIEYIKNTSHIFDLIYIDPARRDNNNQKVFSFEKCTPDIILHLNTLKSKSKYLLIKASTLIDIQLAINQIQFVDQIHIVSLKNDCKEVLFIINNDSACINPTIICVDLELNHKLVYNWDDEKNIYIQHYANEISDFIYEPNVAVLKAGAFKLICNKFNVQKIAPNTHLYTSPYYIADFPGRVFKVVKVIDPKDKSLKNRYFNIITRNFGVGSEALKQKLKTKDGGSEYLIAFKNNVGKPVIIHGQKL